MENKIKNILRDEFRYWGVFSDGKNAFARVDEIVQIYARLFNLDMSTAYEKLEAWEDSESND